MHKNRRKALLTKGLPTRAIVPSHRRRSSAQEKPRKMNRGWYRGNSRQARVGPQRFCFRKGEIAARLHPLCLWNFDLFYQLRRQNQEFRIRNCRSAPAAPPSTSELLRKSHLNAFDCAVKFKVAFVVASVSGKVFTHLQAVDRHGVQKPDFP